MSKSNHNHVNHAAGDAVMMTLCVVVCVSSGLGLPGVNYGYRVQCRQAPCGVAGETLPLASKWENLPELTMVRFLLFVDFFLMARKTTNVHKKCFCQSFLIIEVIINLIFFFDFNTICCQKLTKEKTLCLSSVGRLCLEGSKMASLYAVPHFHCLLFFSRSS